MKLLIDANRTNHAPWIEQAEKLWDLGPVALVTDGTEPTDYLLLVDGAKTNHRQREVQRAVMSCWAGADGILASGHLPDSVPIIRAMDDGMALGMRDYVVGAFLHHVGRFNSHKKHMQNASWQPQQPQLAHGMKIAILGYGRLGKFVGDTLQALGCNIHGVVRKTKPNHESSAVIHEFTNWQGALEGAGALINLLPSTAQTEQLVASDMLNHLADGAVFINAGRGATLREDSLIPWLEKHPENEAILDVFTTEPLPKDHPFWQHPNILVTPHVASCSRPEWTLPELFSRAKQHAGGCHIAGIVRREQGY